jgi:hypothetical protein
LALQARAEPARRLERQVRVALAMREAAPNYQEAAR